jgi:hypothetical protein
MAVKYMLRDRHLNRTRTATSSFLMQYHTVTTLHFAIHSGPQRRLAEFQFYFFQRCFHVALHDPILVAWVTGGGRRAAGSTVSADSWASARSDRL